MKVRSYHVVVSRHRVGRYSIAALAMDVPALDKTHARTLAVREAHRRASVPNWSPWMRESWPHSSAERVQNDEDAQTRRTK